MSKQKDEEKLAKKRMVYLLNKEKCCSLDKGELYELQELLNTYGYPDYKVKL